MNISQKAIILLLFALFIGVSARAQRETRQTREEYIARYHPIAVDHMERYGIPASITLAQGILESDCGNSFLSRSSNNHFGIKCKKNWTGKKVYHDDDEKGECFRKYDDPNQSYEDHSLFLTSRPRYAELFELKVTDYKGWANGLKKCGYATDKAYASKLIGIIELYNLCQYDKETTKKETKKKSEASPHTLYTSWDLPYIETYEGDTFASIGKEFGVKARKLAKYNDLPKNAELSKGMIIYLTEKNKYSKKGYKYHTIKEGESLHSISQKYGMKLSSIYSLNNLSSDHMPQVGDKLKLNKRIK